MKNYESVFLIRLVSVGNLDVAVSLLLSTPPESSYFYANALRAVALSSAVSKSLLKPAVKVVAANMVRTESSLSGTHLLCAVGRYQEACSQVVFYFLIEDLDFIKCDPAGCCKGGPNMSSMLSITSGAGALQEALTALREAQQLDTAAMFILAYHEIRAEFISSLDSDGESSPSNKENCLSCQG
ncbi:unnamed protein product [Ilex paraguariensis]|uniref:WDR11 TPR domain-containing protein n=1 Tax=Ilex paraguariensis TaxID=185542 RepID=A0ABC8TEZ2_9AQUA